jgi:hypothetical protein
MKQTIVIFCLAIAIASCNNAAPSKTGTDSTATTTTTAAAVATEVVLPFKLEQPYKNWQMGSNENVAVVMKALKAYVDKDFATLTSLTGDSLDVTFDYFHSKMSRDSATKFFTGGRAMYNDLVVTMNDYESVISADKKDEWVTIWYKETWKDNKGVADSASNINDIKLKDGKMIILNEMVSHYPKKK